MLRWGLIRCYHLQEILLYIVILNRSYKSTMNAPLHRTMADRGLYGFQIINALDNIVEVLAADEMGAFRGHCLVVSNISDSDT